MVIAYYVLTYSVTLWFLFSSPYQTWWWPYRKRAETCCMSFDSLYLNKVLLCFDLPTLYHCDFVIAHNGDEPPKDWRHCFSLLYCYIIVRHFISILFQFFRFPTAKFWSFHFQFSFIFLTVLVFVSFRKESKMDKFNPFYYSDLHFKIPTSVLTEIQKEEVQP